MAALRCGQPCKRCVLRRDRRDLFHAGHYRPLHASGAKQQHVVAFAREEHNRIAIVAVPRLSYTLAGGALRPRSARFGKQPSFLFLRAVRSFLRMCLPGRSSRSQDNARFYAAKSSRSSPWPCWSAREILGLRSVTVVSAASFSASLSFRAFGAKRQPQLPSLNEGVFIRASLPSPNMSCNGTIASRATDPNAPRMNAQCIPSFGSPK